jgi:predicted N-acetyltransferase YhbS
MNCLRSASTRSASTSAASTTKSVRVLCAVSAASRTSRTQVALEEATARALKGQPQSRPVPAILLARLAVDREHQRAGLGPSLLQDVLLRCVEAAEAIGARILLVHAKHEAAKAWHLQYGFEESPTDPLHIQMLMKDVRVFLKRYVIE